MGRDGVLKPHCSLYSSVWCDTQPTNKLCPTLHVDSSILHHAFGPPDISDKAVSIDNLN